MTEVKKLVDQQRAPMESRIPSASFDMSKNKGKSIWFISPSQATGYALGVSKSVQAAGKVTGIKVSIFDGKGQPDRFTQGFDQAIAAKADGIIAYALDPKLIPNGLKAAKQASIPVLQVNTGKPKPADGTVFESINFDIDAEAKSMADYAAYATDCKLNSATTYDTTYPSLVTMREGIKAELGRLCPDTCKVQDFAMKLPEMATKLGPNTQSLIQRNPDLNMIFATFDQAAIYEIPAVKASGSDVKIVGTNGLPENLDFMRKGEVQIADVSYAPTDYYGWLMVDQLGRAMAGAKTGGEDGSDIVMPVQTLDKDNLGPTDSTADLFPKLANFESDFKGKWGM
jgi:ABC-type sugar transport system substrate-binding protein